MKNFVIEKRDNVELKKSLNWVQVMGQVGYDLMNCEAHWLLAYYYYKLAVDMPELYLPEN